MLQEKSKPIVKCVDESSGLIHVETSLYEFQEKLSNYEENKEYTERTLEFVLQNLDYKDCQQALFDWTSLIVPKARRLFSKGTVQEDDIKDIIWQVFELITCKKKNHYNKEKGKATGFLISIIRNVGRFYLQRKYYPGDRKQREYSLESESVENHARTIRATYDDSDYEDELIEEPVTVLFDADSNLEDSEVDSAEFSRKFYLRTQLRKNLFPAISHYFGLSLDNVNLSRISQKLDELPTARTRINFIKKVFTALSEEDETFAHMANLSNKEIRSFLQYCQSQKKE